MDKETLDKITIRIAKCIKDMEDIDILYRTELIGNINSFLNYEDYLDNIKALNEVFWYKRLKEKSSCVGEDNENNRLIK